MLNITRYHIWRLLLMVVFTGFVSACASSSSEAASAIETYINALGNQDSDQISSISCADWEESALIEIDSLASVGTKVENLSCNSIGEEGETTFVQCSGSLALDYGGDAQQIDLSTRTYIARKESGEWRMCGYK